MKIHVILYTCNGLGSNVPIYVFFFGFLRAGEMTISSESGFNAGAHLTYGDIAVDSVADPNMLRV